MTGQPWVRGELPFLRSGPIHRVHQDAWPVLEDFLGRFDYHRIEIDGRRMTSRVEAHRLLGEAFDFPSWYGPSWDAFDDCLGQFVLAHDGARVAIIWHHLEEAAAHAPVTVAEVGWALTSAHTGAIPSLGAGSSAAVRFDIFAVGDGEDFDRP